MPNWLLSTAYQKPLAFLDLPYLKTQGPNSQVFYTCSSTLLQINGLRDPFRFVEIPVDNLYLTFQKPVYFDLKFFSDSTRFDLDRSEEHTSELQSRPHLVCRLLLE